MKKFIALLACTLVTFGAFALDLGGIQGTWQDSRWDANWTFSADGHIVLTKASNGEEVFNFNDANIQNFKVDVAADGVTITFDCADTNRSYSFNKGVSLSTDLNMVVSPKWDQEAYRTAIKKQ